MMQPRNPDWKADTLAAMEGMATTATLGIRTTVLEPGFVECRMPFCPGLAQQHGYQHAGVVALLADNAGGFAAHTLMPKGAEVLAVEFKLNLMAPAKGEELIARAKVIKSGRTLTVSTIEVLALQDGREVDVALMQQTCIALLPKD